MTSTTTTTGPSITPAIDAAVAAWVGNRDRLQARYMMESIGPQSRAGATLAMALEALLPYMDRGALSDADLAGLRHVASAPALSQAEQDRHDEEAYDAGVLSGRVSPDDIAVAMMSMAYDGQLARYKALVPGEALNSGPLFQRGARVRMLAALERQAMADVVSVWVGI